MAFERNPMPGCNIGKLGRVKRIRRGLLAFGVALGMAALLSRFHAPHVAYVTLFAPFFLATWAIGQGLQGTCGLLALRGMRDTDDGPEKIMVSEEAERVRIAGIRGLWIAAALAAGLTGLLLLTR